MALSALNSCQKPTPALTNSIARMTARSAQWPSAADSAAATSIIHGIGPQKKRASRSATLTLCSASAFSPYCARRLVASASVRPVASAAGAADVSGAGAGLSFMVGARKRGKSLFAPGEGIPT